VLQTDPTQPTGLSYASINSLGANFDPAGVAATAQSNAKTYTDSSIAGLASVYDHAGAAGSVQAAFQTALAGAIGGLNLGTAATHAVSDFDAAGAASTAQAAAKAYTDSVIGSSGVTSSYVNSAITNAIAGLNLLSASQHAASDFDTAGAATAAVNAIPMASGTASGLLSKTDWATFNGKQAALGFTPENSAKKGAASGYAPLDAGSNVPAANLGNLGSAALSQPPPLRLLV
jgi:hypothetical protein